MRERKRNRESEIDERRNLNLMENQSTEAIVRESKFSTHLVAFLTNVSEPKRGERKHKLQNKERNMHRKLREGRGLTETEYKPSREKRVT